MRALVNIAGRDVPEPLTYAATTSTLVDSGRNAQGQFIGSIVRDSMAKIEMTWGLIESEKWSGILKLFNVSLGGSFTNSVTFFDQDSNDWVTREMYVSDKTAEGFKRDKVSGRITYYNNCRIALIEV